MGAAVVAYAVLSQRDDPERRDVLTSSTCEVDTRSDAVSAGDGHVASPVDEVDPPAGGDRTADVAATASGHQLLCEEDEPV